MTPDNVTEILSSVDLFKGLSPEELKEIAPRCRWHTIPSHDQIIDKHSDSRDVYIIAGGEARVVNYSISGREVAFDDLRAGMIFGELAALDGQPRSANVVAITDCLIACISPDDFDYILRSNPEVGIRVMTRLASIIRSSVDRIMDLSTLGANNRVYAELLRLAKNAIIGENVASISPAPIHGDIASRVSTTRETVARVLSDLSKKGVIKRKGNTLNIMDMVRLTEMVEQFKGD